MCGGMEGSAVAEPAILVTGATGVVGDAVVRGLLSQHVGEGRTWRKLYTISRREPLSHPDVIHIRCSLSSPDEIADALRSCGASECLTAAVHCAAIGVLENKGGDDCMQLRRRLPLFRKCVLGVNRWMPPARTMLWDKLSHAAIGGSRKDNVGMAQALWDGLAQGAPFLRSVTQMTGAKASGMHLGWVWQSFHTPLEECVRHPGKNWYYDLESLVEKAAQRHGWNWMVLRPTYFAGFVPGFNFAGGLAAYAEGCRLRGENLRFLGTEKGWRSLQTVTDGFIVADMVAWAAQSGRSQGVLNACNGVAWTWEEIWPMVADYFGLQPERTNPLGEPASFPDAKVAELSTPGRLDNVMTVDWDTHLSTGCRRSAGFTETYRAFDVLKRCFDKFRGDGLILADSAAEQ